MEQIELKSIASRAVGELKDAYKDLRQISGFTGAVSCAPYVVAHVQKLGGEFGLAGGDKKALAVEIILALVPWPAWLPEVVVRPILGWLIERAVAQMKKLAGRF